MSVAARLATALPYAEVSEAHGLVTADVPRERWVEAVTAVRDEPDLDLAYVDVLLAVDEHPRGFDVVVRLWSLRHRHGSALRTSCPRDDARVPSLVGVFGGAAWHEREAAELFGLVFDGHPDLAPLLLEPASGHPLRKDVPLARRDPAAWPGGHDPAGGRRRPQPLGDGLNA
jgi:NADH-quinone oxidoreductase subunit C